VTSSGTAPLHQPSVDPLYEFLDEWSGERFTEAVARGLAKMPKKQARALVETYAASRVADTAFKFIHGAGRQKSPGELRPAIPRRRNAFYAKPGEDLLLSPTLRRTLLFAHSVCFATGLLQYAAYWVNGTYSRIPFASELVLIGQSRELHDANAIHWSEMELTIPWIDDLAGNHYGDTQITPFDNMTISKPGDLKKSIGYQVELSTEGSRLSEMLHAFARNQGDVLLTSPMQHEALEAWMEMAEYYYADLLESPSIPPNATIPFAAELRRFFSLAQSMRTPAGERASLLRLYELDLPDAGMASIQQILLLRKYEDTWLKWRLDLADALNALSYLDSDTPAWPDEARQVLVERLGPTGSELKKSISRSPLASTLAGASKKFGLSTVGAVAGWTAGGSVVSSAAAGAGTALAGALAETITERKRREVQRAHLAHVLSVI